MYEHIVHFGSATLIVMRTSQVYKHFLLCTNLRRLGTHQIRLFLSTVLLLYFIPVFFSNNCCLSRLPLLKRIQRRVPLNFVLRRITAPLKNTLYTQKRIQNTLYGSPQLSHSDEFHDPFLHIS